MRPSQADLAIILRARAYRESDKIVTFLTRDFGKLTGIAMGAKNSRRRFANCLDPLTRVRVYFRSPPRGALMFMESCDLLGAPTAFSDPVKLAYGSYLVELTDQLTAEAHAVPELYDLLDTGLAELERGAATAALLRTFELHLLHLAGYEPHFETCFQCRRRLADQSRVYFDPIQGNLICDGCPSRDSSWLPLSGETILRLEALKQTPLAEARAQRLAPIAASEAAQLLGSLLALHLARPLKSVGLIVNLTNQRE
jgi:DNA repair protein RecO (recombination protein O)